MASSKRRVQQHPDPQGINESLRYTVDTTPWGGSPTAPIAITVLDVTDSPSGTDVTSSVVTGVASVQANVITTPYLGALTLNHVYHVFVRWVSGGQTLETWFELRAER